MVISAFFIFFLTKPKKKVKMCLLFKSVVRSRGQRKTAREESPSFIGTECRRNPGEGDFKESTTENYRQVIGKVEKAR